MKHKMISLEIRSDKNDNVATAAGARGLADPLGCDVPHGKVQDFEQGIIGRGRCSLCPSLS